MGRQPISLRNDGRNATIVVTLPVRYRGGAVIVTEPSFGDTEKFVGRGGKNGDLDWVAFLGDCDYEIDTVQSGCRISVSYGVYIKGFGVPTNAGSVGLPNSVGSLVGDETFITPSDKFFDILSSILNLSRGKKLGFFLNHSYNSDPGLTTADSLIPQVKCIIKHNHPFPIDPEKKHFFFSSRVVTRFSIKHSSCTNSHPNFNGPRGDISGLPKRRFNSLQKTSPPDTQHNHSSSSSTTTTTTTTTMRHVRLGSTFSADMAFRRAKNLFVEVELSVHLIIP